MKNLIIYYFQILLPLPLLYMTLRNEDSILFVTLFIFYYVYRIFTDYYRLQRKNVVQKKDWLFFVLPLWNIKYFNELYFEK